MTSSPRLAGDFLAAFERGDWPATITLIGRHWPILLFSHETYQQGFAALAAAPEEVLRSLPLTAMYAEAIGRFPPGTTPFSLPRGEKRIEDAVRAGSARELLDRSIVAMMAHRVAGDPHRASEIAEASRPLLAASTLTIFSPASEIAGYWYLQAAKAELNTGDITQARLDLELAWLHRALDVSGQVSAEVAPYLALLAALDGDPAGHERWSKLTLSEAEVATQVVDAAAATRPTRLAALLLNGDSAEASALFDSLASELAFDEIWPATLWILVRHAVRQGELTTAEQLTASTLALRPTAPHSGRSQALFVAAARAELALAAGHAALAHQLLGDVTATFTVITDLRDRIAGALAGEAPDIISLTPSERRVLSVLSHPGPLTEAAGLLHISTNTLKTHLRSLYPKLGVSSRAGAVCAAQELGLTGSLVIARAAMSTERPPRPQD